jgi:hypothetical protein
MLKAFESNTRAPHARCAWVLSAALIVAACGGGGTDTQPQSVDMSTAGTSTMSTAGSPTQSAAGTPSVMSAGGAGSAATATGNAGAPATGGAPAAAGSGGAATDGAAGMAGDAGSGAAAASNEPTFTNVYKTLFAVAGTAGCYGCHGGMANPALNGNLAMITDKATAYKALVAAMSSPESVCKEMTRVTAGDPMKSLLYLKLAGMQTCGMSMPPGTPLKPEVVDMVKAWIMAGAMDD